MYEIKDYHRYTELMKNGFYNKLFFVDNTHNKTIFKRYEI